LRLKARSQRLRQPQALDQAWWSMSVERCVNPACTGLLSDHELSMRLSLLEGQPMTLI
jgi:hypothetical protein